MIWKSTVTLEELNASSKNTLVDHIGLTYSAIGDDFLEMTLTVDERNCQPFGFLHGGANCVMAETVAGAASSLLIDLSKYILFGQTMNTAHMKAVPVGQKVRAVATPLKISGSTHVWDIKTYDEAGDVTSVSNHVIAIRPRRDS